MWIPESDNGERLKELREIIADRTRLREMFDEIFQQEQNKK